MTPPSAALAEPRAQRADRAIEVVAAEGGKAPAVLAARILQFQATILSHECFADAAVAFATELATALRFDRAAIGFIRNGCAQVIAASHTADLQSDNDLIAAFAAAMDEALDQSSTVVFPAPPGERPLITLAHEALSRHYHGAAFTVPLVRRGHVFGALTLVTRDAASCTREQVALCEHVACIVGPVLELRWEHARPWHHRLRAQLRHAARKVFEAGSATSRMAAACATVLVIGIMLLPVQYRVGAPARIEGAVQRSLVAPADGYLRHIHTRPGDAVQEGQVLAELADDDLRIERRKWESELTQHDNGASASLARGDRTQYVINQAKADEARAQLELVDVQLARTRVIAPFHGIVIKGDLTQSLGAPLRRGDALLTIAPADQFRLLIEVDERDIADVRLGQNGSLALGALIGHTTTFRVERITPVAVTREGRNYFEVEGRLLSGTGVMRPGLHGVAKIDAGEQTLAWIWTRRITDWLRLTLWSWGL